MLGWAPTLFAADPINLGARRALFVDDFLIAHQTGLETRLQAPVPRETVMVFDAPWEGSGSDFQRLIRVGDTIRMYYMATKLTSTDGKKLGVVVPMLASSRVKMACTGRALILACLNFKARSIII